MRTSQLPLPGRQQLTAAVRRRDWPHDLSACKWKSLASPFALLLKERPGCADGQGESHAGAIRQPFPDVCMCLSMVWYLTDTDSESGGTWIVRRDHFATANMA